MIVESKLPWEVRHIFRREELLPNGLQVHENPSARVNLCQCLEQRHMWLVLGQPESLKLERIHNADENPLIGQIGVILD